MPEFGPQEMFSVVVITIAIVLIIKRIAGWIRQPPKEERQAPVTRRGLLIPPVWFILAVTEEPKAKLVTVDAFGIVNVAIIRLIT